jgi:nicotinamide-nucleotide amidase
MPFSDTSLQAAAAIIEACTERGLTLATAESCTGGLIGACLTEIPGSSAVVDRGFITYSNQAKQDLLGVPAALLQAHGAVSAEVAEAMARGARQRARVDLAIAVTGIAGPGGATPGKPVGLVCLALADGRHAEVVREQFAGGRQAVRMATVERALAMILAALGPGR